MKTPYLLAAFIILFFLLSPPATGLFTSSSHLRTTLSTNTNVFVIGKTFIDGSFSGIPMDHVVDSPLVREMSGFPLVGASEITNLETVIVAEDIDITTATSLEDLLAQYVDHLLSFSDVDITMDNGLFILGINHGSVNLTTDLPYAISTVLPLEITNEVITRFYVIGTNSPMTLQCSGNYAVMNALSSTSMIQIQGKNGQILWDGGSRNDYLIIQDSSFSLIKQPSLSLLPLSDDTSSVSLTVSVFPAEAKDVQIQDLLAKVLDAVDYLEDETASVFLEQIYDLETSLQTGSMVANGAMVFLRTNDTMTIDHSTQQFSSQGFVRFTSLEMTNFASTNGPVVEAESTLCFLGDHFYNPAAKRSSDGLRFPYELLFIWILALAVFLYVRFILRPPIDPFLDAKVKRYALYIHLATLVIAFILVDFEIYTLFGLSGLTSIFSQGISLITGAFFVVEIILWVLGYLLLAVPLQLLSYAILRFLEIGKGGNGIWKAVGDFSIWVFCGFYLLLFLNILLSLLDLHTIIPGG